MPPVCDVASTDVVEPACPAIALVATVRSRSGNCDETSSDVEPVSSELSSSVSAVVALTSVPSSLMFAEKPQSCKADLGAEGTRSDSGLLACKADLGAVGTRSDSKTLLDHGPNTVGSDASSPSSLRSMVKTGVQRAGSWPMTPLTQSLICIAVVRAIFDVGSSRK